MTEVSEQVERVAKAIADDCDDTWDKLLPEQKDHFRCNAIAAIRALEAAQAGAEQVLRDALQSAAESLHHAGCYVAEAEVLAALTTPTRIEAAQPQEEDCPNCDMPLGRDGGCYYPYCDNPQKPVATPPQAAESGLLDEAIDLLRRIHPDPDYDTVEQYYAFLAKAGKPGEAGNG